MSNAVTKDGALYPSELTHQQDCGTDLNATSSSNLEDLPQITDVPTELPSDPEDLDASTSVSNLEDFPQATPVGVPPDTDVSQCQCVPVFCAQSWPQSCQCSNQAASDCAQLCGRPIPQFVDCDAADSENLDAQLPTLFDMVSDPKDIPVIFTVLISDTPDPQELPEYLENLPEYLNDLVDDDPWSETHTWFSFFAQATSKLDDLLSDVLSTPTDASPQWPSLTGFTETSVTFSSEENVVATPSITESATKNYRVCGHRNAQSCPTGYECFQRPGANCGPELDCGGYCVDVLNGVTLLADTTTQTSSTLSSTISLSFPTDTLRTSTTRRNIMLPPRQLGVDTAALPATTTTSSVESSSTSSSVFPQIRCGEGYPACDPGLECVDIYVSGIGFAEKRSYCAAAAASDSLSSSSSLSTASTPSLDLDPTSIPSLDLVLTSVSSLNLVPIPTPTSSPTHPPWPDTAWTGPITTLKPMFGPGPVGMSLLPNFTPSSTPIALQQLQQDLTSAAAAALPISTAAALDNQQLPRQIIGPIVPPPAGGNHPISSISSSASASASTTTTRTAPPPPSEPAPFRCGGPDAAACPGGLSCVRDLDPDADRPYGGCGPSCGEYGVCIVPQSCGGFAGTPCGEEGRLCVDDPNDDCDPENGGADCVGMCV
ncbi:hypothetical protein SLS55_008943 [Diplodia seriata]|uniref:Uncharacterized protein n=1 Tax=Diplodia seriata TaxID=420778 RepID=A0ABR3C7G3_9PEZI